MNSSILCGLAAATALLSLAAGCDKPLQGSLDAERTTHGDTLVVRTLGGSVWDTTATLVEELRIGKLDGPEEEMFGSVAELAPDGHGGVYVFDSKAPALRHFDSTGRFVAKLGGKGAGPGEYQDVALGLAVLPDGRVAMRDPRNGRINLYSPDGKPAGQWPVSSGLFTSNAMSVDTAGEFYLKVLLGAIQPKQPWPVGLLHMSSTGKIIDSISAPTLPGEPSGDGSGYSPSKIWEISPQGYVVAGVNAPAADGSYSFWLLKRDGSVVKVEKYNTAIGFQPEEKSEHEARNAWIEKTQGQFMTSPLPPIPDTKPAYHGFDIGGDGQIWVRPFVPAEKGKATQPVMPPGREAPPSVTWREPVVYDVFEPDGTYLGRLKIPPHLSLWAHSGNEVWGTVEGDSGELYVVRYRIDASAASTASATSDSTG
jgi:hypothetical protein